ncbi:MAG: primosomal protein N' [Acholeplasmataceae bacterium]|nr:primosomal protein N' [Acholeplasmataceae bacterium]
MIAEVIIDIGHQQVNQTYDYIVPEALSGHIERGMRVIVPFGSTTRLGFVIHLKDQSDQATKTVMDVLDVFPTIGAESFEIIRYLEKTTGQPYGRLFQTVVPRELLVSYNRDVILLDASAVDEKTRALFNAQGRRRLNKDDTKLLSLFKRLKDQGIVQIRTVLEQRGKARLELAYRFNRNHRYAKIDQYQMVTDLFRQKEHISRRELLDEGVTASRISTLEKHDVLIRFELKVDRPYEGTYQAKTDQIKLTPVQEQAVSSILTDPLKTSLLHGITGSGKTEVYIEVIRRLKEVPGQVLILVPEIALAGPIYARVSQAFEDVALYHSGLSEGVRFDQFEMIREQRASVVIGTRSAVFLPFDRLKLVIVDEEHDDQYIQNRGLYYDARSIVGLRAKWHDARLILGSATPRTVTTYDALAHKINHIEMNERPFGLPLPKLHLIDMREELKEAHTGILSRRLERMIEDRLKAKEQTILMFNRKGYAPYVMCRQCGHVPTCPSCEISLTYFKDDNSLRCPYCGHKASFSKTCPVCHQAAIREVGTGLDYVTERVKVRFPKATIVKMDALVTRTKGAHERLWQSVASRKADILIGTEMVAKGLDFPKVTLSAVLMADQAFRIPSYLADEQAYQLFAQLTGRSGRSVQGEAVIQGYDLDHMAIKGVSEGYRSFYQESLYKRKIMHYPPFGQVAMIQVEGEGYLRTYQEAFTLKKTLLKRLRSVLGPTAARQKKMVSNYRFNLVLKDDDINLEMVFEAINGLKPFVRVTFIPDIDEGK